MMPIGPADRSYGIIADLSFARLFRQTTDNFADVHPVVILVRILVVNLRSRKWMVQILEIYLAASNTARASANKPRPIGSTGVSPVSATLSMSDPISTRTA